jgi:hypothetical protein
MVGRPQMLHRTNSAQARRGLQSGHPELSVECPQCHSSVGRTCFMGPGFMGITHHVRRALYQERRRESSAVQAVV